MDLGEEVKSLLRAHPTVRSVSLVGSRQRKEATALSDWDLEAQVDDFDAFKNDLPHLVEELRPLGGQWDPLSDRWNYMLFLPGPVKVDIIVDLPHEGAEPWTVSGETLPQIDHHFWDWMLWLGSKQLRGMTELVEQELEKMWIHLLRPLGVEAGPRTLPEGLDVYRRARNRAQERLGVRPDTRMEGEVIRAFTETGLVS